MGYKPFFQFLVHVLTYFDFLIGLFMSTIVEKRDKIWVFFLPEIIRRDMLLEVQKYIVAVNCLIVILLSHGITYLRVYDRSEKDD